MNPKDQRSAVSSQQKEPTTLASASPLTAHSSPLTDIRATRILGIDPGSQRTGIGIIEVDQAGRSRHVFNCAINLLDNETFAARLKQLFDELGAIIADYAPHECAVERVFVSKNADSALKLGQARGAAICAVVSRGLTISEYAAREVKQSVVGTGSGDKTQVQHMVGVLLNLHEKLQADAADALAIALTHAHVRASVARLGMPDLAWRRRR